MLRKIALLVVAVVSMASCVSDSPVSTTAVPARGDFVAAPEFPPDLDWLNTTAALTMADLEGKVVLLDFWTYGCINCIHIIPDLKRLEEEYSDELVVIGVHSAKFEAEAATENIRQVVLRYGIEHPVVNDSDFTVWNAWGARAWPTVFVVGPDGGVVGYHAGEGVYEVVQPVIAGLINEQPVDRAPLEMALEIDSQPRTVLSFPGKVLADDSRDRLFIADTNHHRILNVRISDGQILGAYGSGVAGFSDGVGTGSSFRSPQGMSLMKGGTTLLVADTGNHAVRSVDLETGTVTTIAGTGAQAGYPPSGGPGVSTNLSSPWDLVTTDDGTVLIAMAGTHQIWVLETNTGNVAPLVGSAREGTRNGSLAASELAQPSGLAVAPDGRVFFADSESSSIRQVDLDRGQVDLLAGATGSLFEFGDVDAVGDSARFQHPLGVDVVGGHLFVADTYNSKIKRVDIGSGEVQTVAGSEAGWADGRSARFYEPGGLSGGEGVIYVADTNNHVIRLLDIETGETTTMVLKGAENFLPATASGGSSGSSVLVPPVSVRAGAIEVVLNIGLPIGYKVNPDAPSSFEFSLDGTGASVDSPGVVVDPSLPIVISASIAPGSTRLTGDVSLIYCESEQESICLIEQIQFLVPLVVDANGDESITLDHQIDLPGL